MNPQRNTREALIAEVIGDVAQLLKQADAVSKRMDESRQALLQANASLRESLAGFEQRMTVVADNTRGKVVTYVVGKIDEASHRAIERQSSAMADAARTAFGVQVASSMERLRVMLAPLVDAHQRRFDAWLVYAAVAVVSSIATWVLAVAVTRV